MIQTAQAMQGFSDTWTLLASGTKSCATCEARWPKLWCVLPCDDERADRVGPVVRWVGASRFVVLRPVTGHEAAAWVAALDRLTEGGTWRLTVPQGWCTVGCFLTWAGRQEGPVVRAVSTRR